MIVITDYNLAETAPITSQNNLLGNLANYPDPVH